MNITELDKDVQTGKYPHDIERVSSDKFYEESDNTLEKVKASYTNG